MGRWGRGSGGVDGGNDGGVDDVRNQFDVIDGVRGQTRLSDGKYQACGTRSIEAQPNQPLMMTLATS